VTAFLNGRAGLGPDIDSAVRQALHSPPHIDVERPSGPLFVGSPVELSFRVRSAQSEVVTITSSAGRQEASLGVTNGRGTVVWLPPAPGRARVRVRVDGLDGTSAADTVALRIFSSPPSVQFVAAPTQAVVGRRVRVSFEATNSLREVVSVSTRGGVLTRHYLIRNGTGFIDWTPRTPGSALFRVTARGGQGQAATDRVRVLVAPGHRPVASTVTHPDSATVTAIRKARAALARAESRFALHQYGGGLIALDALRRAAGQAHSAAIAQIGKPPVDPESDEPPGPAAVLAVLNLEHRIAVRIPAIFNGMRRELVVSSLRHTLLVTHRRRDRMLDIVIALDREGAGDDYADGMADTLPAFAREVNTLQEGLDTYELTPSGRAGLIHALSRARATRNKVNAAFGGGE
jgi:hypothetical protein